MVGRDAAISALWGAFQEVKDRIIPRKLVRIRYLKAIKYILAVAWVGAIVFAAVSAGGYKTVKLLYNTESGVSVDSIEDWFMYSMIVFIILLPAFFIIGKRGFCHYFCPWGVLNIAATRVKDFFRWPSLHMEVKSGKCQECHTCDKACPMSLPISNMVANGSMRNTECILCGTCVDSCPNGAIKYSWKSPKKQVL